MLRRVSLFTLAFICLFGSLWAQEGKIAGRVTDSKGEPAPFATVLILVGEEIKNGATTDDLGQYSIQPVEPGTYTVKAKITEEEEITETGVTVLAGQTRKLDLTLVQTGKQDTTNLVKIKEFKEPLIVSGGPVGGTVDGKSFQQTGIRDVQTMASTVAGVYQSDGGRFDVRFRGAGTSGTQYIVDGVKVRGNPNLPQSAIGSMQVITGGTPAEYGDFTGGVISISTTNPANALSGGMELQTSELLDAYGRNLIAANLSGPLITKTEIVNYGGSALPNKRSVLGFFLSGEYDYQLDARPAAKGIYKISDDLLSDLEKNPLVFDNTLGTFVPRANYISEDDIILTKVKAMNQDRRLRGLGRLDFKPKDNMLIKLGVSGEYYNSPSGANISDTWNIANMLFAPNGGASFSGGLYRTWLKFQQNFTDNTGLLKNFYYTVQGDYSLFNRTLQNPTHQGKLWDYGHVGKFDYDLVPFYAYNSNPGGDPFSSGAYWTTVGYGTDNMTFDATNSKNPLLANYNTYLFDYVNNGGLKSLYGLDNVGNTNILQFLNGIPNGSGPDGAYGMFSGVGSNSGTYQKSRFDQYRLTGQATAEVKKHNLKVGFEFEQRTERTYTLGARSLWFMARQLTNRHLDNLETDPNLFLPVMANGEFQDTVNIPLKAALENQTTFDRNLRTKLGLNPDGTDWINTDAISPDDLNSWDALSFFSANELIDPQLGGIASYYGYDYLGKPIKRGDPSKFFTDKQNRPQNPFSPTYISGFVQDKFEFEDIIFNIGLRVDRFDANQKVLRDNYILAPFYTAAETYKAVNGDNSSLPSGIGQDWVAYVDNAKNPTQILGYRDGDSWYDENGTPTSAAVIEGRSGGKVKPHIETDEVTIDAFEDYKPQNVFMPRLAFSFPINEKAEFFAHYDVLAQRPGQQLSTQQSLMVGLLSEYSFLAYTPTTRVRNANLKSEVTVDYEAGFKQVVGTSSALTISAYYREMRNMIAFRKFDRAYPFNYSSYDNVDFGTVKGFSLSYDMRRIKNIQLRASYNLQFADKTNSAFSDGRNITDFLEGTGLLRNLQPDGFDQRHRLTGVIDYRYEESRGPGMTLGGKTFYPLDQFGANATFTVGSGNPYSRQSNITADAIQGVGGTSDQLLGSPAGSRLPWTFRTDLRFDKNFSVGGKLIEGSKDRTRQYDFNVYLMVMNAFNSINILGVYAYTGLPDDDGFLSSNIGNQTIQAQVSPETFVAMYKARLLNPDNFSVPRRIRLGVMFNF